MSDATSKTDMMVWGTIYSKGEHLKKGRKKVGPIVKRIDGSLIHFGKKRS